ncbi:hypothetical protein E5E91_16215 (plasmid) [Deinococcus radiodurans R1 = ATCC 13939 = DSM 20539]|uniref:Uncharacterized protein n=1 Tax=Deinococcus radiodurans (strain ATCC 13939 / DSM 20539 / JCM 16871 / CCUG 27074 / LMG 4051 / NBRC 15346 / NCIMB 9279 / VKM B-1422 / R1) TaxID=243230 RepID=Q9RZJ7_DEIRA|nr:hypothetical protein DR_B0130 [Deinococcus radiodurans R1 = ATCC 13939 = DSM 20539]ANC73234.1 hypothetical protein A2G07_15400 [Deinococcus radiodurans R1 = ATCC 13939 = DSM 20539]QEM73222.1 hypothetical protein DXG80_15590 [Deinococcus radiodurans]UDL02254.1 hypothetical protein E5E91_16215 [Deinococcus radiodurans R1 = ATCC 13939 = DSM 20539]
MTNLPVLLYVALHFPGRLLRHGMISRRKPSHPDLNWSCRRHTEGGQASWWFLAWSFVHEFAPCSRERAYFLWQPFPHAVLFFSRPHSGEFLFTSVFRFSFAISRSA